MASLVKNVPLPIQPGAPHVRPTRVMFGLRALACSISHHSYPRLQFTLPRMCSWLGSAPEVELVSPPISTFRICRAAPNPGLNK
jgi:hypothetical protein